MVLHESGIPAMILDERVPGPVKRRGGDAATTPNATVRTARCRSRPAAERSSIPATIATTTPASQPLYLKF